MMETLIVETKDRVTLITLNRPKALNALSAQLLSELMEALDAAETDDAVHCVVLTGSERAFAAGADIKEMSTKSYADMFNANYFGPAAERSAGSRKPIIAAVSGYALGGGCELAMLCDFIIASETAKFGQPEITLGVAPGMGGSQRLTRFVGKSKAMDMVLTGRMMDAAEAERSGLVSRLVPADKLMDEAMATAQTIAALSPLAVKMNKEMVNAAYETTLEQGLKLERRLFHSLFAFDDQSEGMAAFIEKRKPEFKGT
jgi:enoyl-CoA hydratase/carnithine racemase